MLDGIPVANIGAGGLLAITVLLILLGRLVPGRRVDEMRADFATHLDEVRADKDAQIIMWRAVAETSQAQMGELLEHSRLSVQLLTSIEARANAQADKS